MKYFGLDDCRAYLKEHFHPMFLRAFDCIKANAGKVNLFRAAVVYREGGWYSDWKEEVKVHGLLDKLTNGKPLRPKQPKINAGSQSIVFTWGRGSIHERKNNCIMNGFFGAKPRHPSKLFDYLHSYFTFVCCISVFFTILTFLTISFSYIN